MQISWPFHPQMRSLKESREGRPTCSEEEHRHNAVVLPLRTPAEGNEGHQKRHQSRDGAGPQEHQGGDLPVCRTGHKQVREEHPTLTTKHLVQSATRLN